GLCLRRLGQRRVGAGVAGGGVVEAEDRLAGVGGVAGAGVLVVVGQGGQRRPVTPLGGDEGGAEGGPVAPGGEPAHHAAHEGVDADGAVAGSGERLLADPVHQIGEGGGAVGVGRPPGAGGGAV